MDKKSISEGWTSIETSSVSDTKIVLELMTQPEAFIAVKEELPDSPKISPGHSPARLYKCFVSDEQPD